MIIRKAKSSIQNKRMLIYAQRCVYSNQLHRVRQSYYSVAKKAITDITATTKSNLWILKRAGREDTGTGDQPIVPEIKPYKKILS